MKWDVDLKRRVARIKEKPTLLSILGWLFFPGMYFLVGIFSYLGMSVENAFIIASPLAILGLICWFGAFYFSLAKLMNHQFGVTIIFAWISSLMPLAFISFALWMTFLGV